MGGESKMTMQDFFNSLFYIRIIGLRLVPKAGTVAAQCVLVSRKMLVYSAEARPVRGCGESKIKLPKSYFILG